MNMSPINGNDPGGQARVVSAVSAPQQDGQWRGQRSAPTALVVAYAVLLLAAPGLRHDWLVVWRCPWCGSAHRHLLFDSTTRNVERSPSCARHRTYRVEITSVVPASASTGRAA